jgi:hypothetical protein
MRSFLFVLPCLLAAQTPAPLSYSASPVLEKNFYLLTRLEGETDVKRMLLEDAELRSAADAKRSALAKAADTCALEASCLLNAVRFRDEEVSSIASRLRALAAEKPALRSLVSSLRGSGVFIRYHSMTDAELLDAAWRDSVKGIHNLIAVHGEGKAPRYPAIDSISFEAGSERYRRVLAGTAAALDTTLSNDELFFTPSLRFAMGSLRTAFDALGRVKVDRPRLHLACCPIRVNANLNHVVRCRFKLTLVQVEQVLLRNRAAHMPVTSCQP